MKTDHLSDIDMAAYIDGELDMRSRFRLEDRLSRHPELAAAVMAELRNRSALQLITAPKDDCCPAGWHGLARKIHHSHGDGPRRKRPWKSVGFGMTAMAAAIIFVSGWKTSPPPYVFDAAESHRTAMLRANMASQVESPQFDAGEILKRTRIAMPVLPADWRITDVQLFPAERGPALLIAVRTANNLPLSIFAVREASEAPERPDAVREGTQSVAFWRRGPISYALTGEEDPTLIDAQAEKLANMWKS
ncbi:anti-sigma factor [Altericroceibacterium spongiae]|uniref:Anti-sigma factor n=1 Tax=Altericroceibacterium spongiae TaxID=2320269 RepID=A0A420EQQ4_9SPHN|nr:anti-sigma factor [Altericroceibacterium spongiae]RKF23009.1 anti-sigma factor [Altericroceibacterium spongiae]